MEDDKAVAAPLRSILARLGYEVAVAATVAEASALLEGRSGWIILDLMLPDGDGAEVLRQVRARKLSVRVIVTTGAGDRERIEAARRLAPEALLLKPVALAELLRILEPRQA